MLNKLQKVPRDPQDQSPSPVKMETMESVTANMNAIQGSSEQQKFLVQFYQHQMQNSNTAKHSPRDALKN